KIMEKTGLSFDLVDLFSYPTVKSFAEFLSDKKEMPEIKARKEISKDDIAVIGMAGRFPGAADIDRFWKNLAEGRESVHFFSDTELREAGVSEELLQNPRYVKANA